MEEFKLKGFFSIAEFEQISTSHQSCITPFQFGKLVKGLRNAAHLKIDNEEKYFIPCALTHADESIDYELVYSTPVPPLYRFHLSVGTV